MRGHPTTSSIRVCAQAIGRNPLHAHRCGTKHTAVSWASPVRQAHTLTAWRPAIVGRVCTRQDTLQALTGTPDWGTCQYSYSWQHIYAPICTVCSDNAAAQSPYRRRKQSQQQQQQFFPAAAVAVAVSVCAHRTGDTAPGPLAALIWPCQHVCTRWTPSEQGW
jgi:hypothetical protein